MRLKHTSDIEKASIIVPPSHTPHIFEYGFDVLVKEAVASVRAAHLENAAAEEKYGLYYPRLGIWLDDGKTLFSYDLQLEVGAIVALNQSSALTDTILAEQPRAPRIGKPVPPAHISSGV